MISKTQTWILIGALALFGGCTSASKTPVVNTQADAIACRQMRNATTPDTFVTAAQAASKANDPALHQAGEDLITAFATLDIENAEAIGIRLGLACRRLGL